MTTKTKKSRKTIKRLSHPVHNTKNTISVCMIVKDEEKFLENCLKSVKDIADEIIIIDTGSKDKTVEIAKKYTDNIYFHPWKDSFSEARNHYFEYVKGDWIFQIDADEELVKDDIPALLKAVKRSDIDAIRVQLISTYKKGEDESRHSAERIFRNNGIIHYEGRVHNRLVDFKCPAIHPIRLMHYGYDLDDAELTEKKHQRRIALLKQDIEEKPDNPLPYHYLGCCYLSKGQNRETLEVSLKAIELAEQQKDKNPVYLWSRYNAAMAWYRLKDFEKAEELSKAAIKINDLHIDSYFILTLVSHDLKKWEDTISFGTRYLE
ncbi:MAG: glycosyltransferase, partial [Desulfatiglans sp.]|nr:glycosyltransferase [Desulfatiglans sp.]